ncbi:MAG: hypothetical protein OXH01_09950 [Bacteroidetes bacterium]|nr:hypothetical protein [Bacteroidota bacterium]
MSKKEAVVRLQTEGQPEAISPHVYRKQILRYGKWAHPKAPEGEFVVDRPLLENIVKNFRSKVLDQVTIPLDHNDKAGISSIGEIIDLEVDDEGLWGTHYIADEQDVAKVASKRWKGTSALLHLDYLDREKGERVGPVLLHNAITNMPVITKLAPFEAVALGEDVSETDVISLEAKEVQVAAQTVEDILAALAELSDEEVLRYLEENRSDLVGSLRNDADIRAEGKAELVEELKAKGLVIELPVPGQTKTEVHVDEHPSVMALSEEVAQLKADKARTDAEQKVDSALSNGFIAPAQRDHYVELALSNADLFEKILPAEPVIDLSEVGASQPSSIPKVSRSKADDAEEVQRYITAYHKVGKEG